MRAKQARWLVVVAVLALAAGPARAQPRPRQPDVPGEVDDQAPNNITAAELTLGRNSLIGAFTIENQSTVSRAILNGRNEMLDLGYNAAESFVKRVKKVKREDVLRVAKKYLHLENTITVVLTP